MLRASVSLPAPSISIPREFLERYIAARSPDVIELGDPNDFSDSCFLVYTSARGILLKGERLGAVPGDVIELRSYTVGSELPEVCLLREPFDQLTVKRGSAVSVELTPRYRRVW